MKRRLSLIICVIMIFVLSSCSLFKTSEAKSLDRLIEFEGTVGESVTLSHNAGEYAFLVIELIDVDGNVVASSMMPTGSLQNRNLKIYGSSGDQWGSFKLAEDYTTAEVNRTARNTSVLTVDGVFKMK